jgi:hypothetical protein
MSLTFDYLPNLEILTQLKNNPENQAQFEKQVAIYQQRIFEELSLAYQASAQTQENVDTIIEGLIAKVAELAIAGHILDKLVGDYSQWIDLEQLGENSPDQASTV